MKLCNLTPNEYEYSVNKRRQQQIPSATSLFLRTPAVGEPDTLPTGMCGAKIRPQTLNPSLKDPRPILHCSFSEYTFPRWLIQPRPPHQAVQQVIAVGVEY
jgi:hypothetical protein